MSEATRALGPRVLLLMSTRGYRAEAFLDAASALGVAATVGTDKEQSLAFLNPAGNLTLDFNDPEAAADLAERFHQLNPITAVVAAEEDGLLLAAHIAQRLDLPWRNPPASVCAARNKLVARERWRKAGLHTPDFQALELAEVLDPERLAISLDYPCVLKPLSLSGSRGVIRADDPASFVAAFERLKGIVDSAEREALEAASEVGARPPSSQPSPAPSRPVLIEGFIPGREFALEGMLSDGELRVLALFDKPDPLDGPHFEETIYVTPSRLPEVVQEEVAMTVQRAAKALGLRQGPVHAEMRVAQGPGSGAGSREEHAQGDVGSGGASSSAPDGPARVTMLELSPRSIGGLCSRSLRFVEEPYGERAGEDDALARSRFSYETLILRHALGQPTDAISREHQASGVMMIPNPGAGILRGIVGLESARAVPAVDEIRISVTPGTRMIPLPEACQYPGFIFARARTPQIVESALREAFRRLEFELDGLRPEIG